MNIAKLVHQTEGLKVNFDLNVKCLKRIYMNTSNCNETRSGNVQYSKLIDTQQLFNRQSLLLNNEIWSWMRTWKKHEQFGRFIFVRVLNTQIKLRIISSQWNWRNLHLSNRADQKRRNQASQKDDSVADDPKMLHEIRGWRRTVARKASDHLNCPNHTTSGHIQFPLFSMPKIVLVYFRT